MILFHFFIGFAICSIFIAFFSFFLPTFLAIVLGVFLSMIVVNLKA